MPPAPEETVKLILPRDSSRGTRSRPAAVALLLLSALAAVLAHPLSAGADMGASFPASLAQALGANARWASGVVAYSSQYTATDWSAAQALGYPDTYPDYGDRMKAWASLTQDGQREFIELSFDDPSPASYLVAVETYNPGAIDSVYTWNPDSSRYDLAWSAPASPGPVAPRLWIVTFPTTAYPVSRVRLALNSPAVHGWNEIDAVAIGANGFVSRQWASDAVASSHYGVNPPQKATGPPDVYPMHFDATSAWASLTADGGREWLQLTYAAPEPISRVLVYQTYNPGAIDSIYVRDALDGALHLVYSAVAAAQPLVATILTAVFPKTPFSVDAVRITLASDQVPGWNEIDAVMISDTTEFVLPGITGVPGSSAGVAGIESVSPNPFRSGSTIRFSLAREGPARLQVFDVRGARVATLAAARLASGTHSLTWNGLDDSGHRVGAGLYFIELDAAGARATRRLVRLR